MPRKKKEDADIVKVKKKSKKSEDAIDVNDSNRSISESHRFDTATPYYFTQFTPFILTTYYSDEVQLYWKVYYSVPSTMSAYTGVYAELHASRGSSGTDWVTIKNRSAASSTCSGAWTTKPAGTTISLNNSKSVGKNSDVVLGKYGSTTNGWINATGEKTLYWDLTYSVQIYRNGDTYVKNYDDTVSFTITAYNRSTSVTFNAGSAGGEDCYFKNGSTGEYVKSASYSVGLSDKVPKETLKLVGDTSSDTNKKTITSRSKPVTVTYANGYGCLTKTSDTENLKYTDVYTGTPSVYSQNSVTASSGSYYSASWSLTSSKLNGAFNPDLPGLAKERDGYKATYFTDSNGSRVGNFGEPCYKSYTDSTTLTANWEAYKYTFNYDYDQSKSEAEGKGYDPSKTLKQFTKTYGTELNLTKDCGFTKNPTKGSDNAYKFNGWKGPKSGKLYTLDNPILKDDEFPGNESRSTYVILTADWTPIPNKINLYYKTATESHLDTPEVRTYIWPDVFGPFIIDNPIWTDHAFVGWSTKKPAHADGVYDSIEDVEAEGLNPIERVIKDRLNYPRPWGTIDETYYGVWIRSGKKVKVNNIWRDVFASYVKVKQPDGTLKWKRIVGTWSKVGDNWKKEIYQKDENN